MRFLKTILLLTLLFAKNANSQNSMVGDGFGGRLWYNPSNYSVGSYSGYNICDDICGGGEAQLYGWGYNGYNQLGLGIAVPGVNVPTLIPNTAGVKYFSTGYIMGAIKNDNTGWAWGGDITGAPIEVINDAKFLDASSTTISFIKNDGTVWSIGKNASGNFGDGTTTDSPTIPVKMQVINNAVRVANNFRATIILLDDGTLMSVGNNVSGCLGVSGVTSTTIPIPITGIPYVVDIKSTALGTIALTDAGDVYIWGSDFSALAETPTLVPGLSNIVAISGCDDGEHYMALDNNKNCYAWGVNDYGNCGLSATAFTVIPTPTLVETDVIDIMAGETFSYLIKSNGTLWAAGTSIVSGSSIWLNLSDVPRDTFTKLDPSELPLACGITASTTDCILAAPGTITVNTGYYGGQAPFTYSIGGAFQSSNIFNGVPEGTYNVTVQDVNGCESTISVTVNGQDCSVPPIVFLPEGHIDFPNVFSPNQDPENQHFYFPNEGLTEINCKIFDRWGVLVYEWSETNGYWDGKNSDGKNCIEGTYYYSVYYSIFDAPTKTNHGFITLVR
jgi:gliding motility-associated-like protein